MLKDTKQLAKVYIANLGAGLWIQSSMEARLAADLCEQGFDVSLISCDGFMEGKCSVRSARKSSSGKIEKKIDCRDCQFTSQLMSSNFNHSDLDTLYLGSRVSKDDKEEARRIAKKAMAMDDPLKFAIDGMPIGKIASYEVILHHKILDSKFTGDSAIDLENAIRDCYLTGVAIRSLLLDQSSQATFVVRSPQYATHHVICLEASKAGHRVIFLDGSPNISESSSHATVWDWSLFRGANPARDEFDVSKVLGNIPVDQLVRIETHRQSLQSAKSHKVYSESKKGNPSEVMSELGLRGNSKILLIALSSSDEVISSRMVDAFPKERYPGVVFESQVEWVKGTISWAISHPQVDVVIRVHPREFPNSRNRTRSSMADVWEKLLSELPSNVKLNHPDQGISIYDLFTVVDVVSTGWSSVGVEAAAEGLPLVLYDSGLPGYPHQLGRGGVSAKEYFVNLETALGEEPDGEANKQKAMAWLDFQMNLGTFRVGGRMFESRRYLFPRWLTLIFEGVDRYFFFVSRPLDMLMGKLRKSESIKIVPVLNRDQTSLFR